MHGLSVHSSGRCCPQMPSLCCQASYFGPGRVRTHAVSPRNQAGSGCDNLQSTARLFQQHKLLLGAGFSYDQASLILQVSQQRKAAATQAVTVQGAPSPTSASGADNPPTAGAGAGQPPGADPVGTVAAVSSTGTSTQQSGTALQGLEERIAFLEMELLKQSLAAAPLIDTNTSTSSAAPPAAAAGATPFGTTSVTAREGRNTVGAFRRGVTLLSPAGAGAGHLNAAAEAAVQQQYEQQQQMKMLWTADSVLTRSGSSSQPWLAGGSNGGNAVAATSQLAAAAELGELDPEVLAIAEALAIRQGLGSLLPEPQGLELSHLVQQGGQKQMQLQDQQHRNSILGRTAWYSAPLQAHAWGGRKAAGSRAAGGYSAGGYGGPRMMTPSDYQADDEMVPYNPSGWAVAATFGVVYLGVIVTFLAMCVGDVPY